MTTEEIIKHLEKISRDAKRYKELRKLVEQMRFNQNEAKQRKCMQRLGLISDWNYGRILNHVGASEYALDKWLEENL